MQLKDWELSYIKILNRLRERQLAGDFRGNRTNKRTTGGFGLQLDVDLLEDFPALITKTVHLPSMVAELLWFLSGDTNIAWLKENGCRIWNEWADEKGELGPVYGKQWRSWHGRERVIDQIAQLITDLRENPNSRRMIVSAWNPEDLPLEKLSPQENVKIGRQALAPCHMAFQAYVEPLTLDERITIAKHHGVPQEVANTLWHQPGRQGAAAVLDKFDVPTRGLSLRVDQRSADWVLGVPFNVASYATLAHLLAWKVGRGLTPHKLVMQFGDYHLYENHDAAAEEQIQRALHLQGTPGIPVTVKEGPYSYPYLVITADRSIPFEMLSMEDLQFGNYAPMGPIKAEVAV